MYRKKLELGVSLVSVHTILWCSRRISASETYFLSFSVSQGYECNVSPIVGARCGLIITQSILKPVLLAVPLKLPLQASHVGLGGINYVSCPFDKKLVVILEDVNLSSILRA